MLHTCVFGSVSGEGQVSGVISMADPTTPLLLQNIRVTALLLQNETAEIGDPTQPIDGADARPLQGGCAVHHYAWQWRAVGRRDIAEQ